MGKRIRLDTEEFIRRAKLAHGEDKYDYSKTIYTRAKEKVDIICKEHGLFKMCGHHHMTRKQGCPKCVKNIKWDTDLLISKYVEKYGHKFTFNKVKYVNSDTHVIITCNMHGDFSKRPFDFMKNGNCQKCTKKDRKSQDEFISECNKIHNNKYDYSKVKFTKVKDKITIICKEHGEFSQTASQHKNGRGCRFCSKNMPDTTDTFIEKARKIHGDDKYDYSLVDYINAQSKVKIRCIKHDFIFEQKVNNHLNNKGCPKCGNELIEFKSKEGLNSWKHTHWVKLANISKNFDSFKVYIIKCWNGDEIFYKIGKTFLKVKQRYYGRRSLPYKFEIIKIFESDDGIKMSHFEHILQKTNHLYKYEPIISFHGMKECYSKLDESILKMF